MNDDDVRDDRVLLITGDLFQEMQYHFYFTQICAHYY